MRCLLDTCVFLWVVAGSESVPLRVRAVLADPDNEVLLSSVSGWEIAAKHSLGKLPLPSRPDIFVPAQRAAHGIESLALSEEHVLSLHKLPALHRDPFDRMLVCQAIVDGLVLVTPDDVVTQYPVRTLW